MKTKLIGLMMAAAAFAAVAITSIPASAQTTTYATPGGPYASVVGRPLILTAVASNVEISSYRWDFGNGDFAEGREVAKAYFTPGVYTVSLTVTTAAGQTSTATTTAQILPYPTLATLYPCAVTTSAAIPVDGTDTPDVILIVTRCYFGVPVDEVRIPLSSSGQPLVPVPLSLP